MKMQNSTRILAIDSGTREMGSADLQGCALIDHGVKVIKRGGPPQETLDRGMAIVAGLIEDFRPEVLIMEQTFVGRNRNAALLNVFADEIKALAKPSGLEVMTFVANAVKKAVCGHGWASKAEVAKAVVGRYPELKAHLFKERKWKERLHANMFDAVALGMMVV
jgi:Holliday junction resolvasome RuvABC endonuclease subunit